MLATIAPVRSRTDRLGVCASAACAVHCAIAPVIPFVAPAVATWWSSPLVHVLGAVLVVPLALIALHGGRKRHGRRGPLRCAWCGCVAICLALLPWWTALPAPTWTWGAPQAICSPDTCCPTIIANATGGAIVAPWPTLITLLGSLLLVAGHLGNLVAGCRGCDPAALAMHKDGAIATLRLARRPAVPVLSPWGRRSPYRPDDRC